MMLAALLAAAALAAVVASCGGGGPAGPEIRIPLGAGGVGFLPLLVMKERGLIEKRAAAAGVPASVVAAQQAKAAVEHDHPRLQSAAAATYWFAWAAYAVGGLGVATALVAGITALAQQGTLGLVCDPLGGLVELPCVFRNATGAAIALAAIEMAMAGIEFAIPADEVIDTMGDIGRSMDVRYRETAGGGLAATPTGRRLAKERLYQIKRSG